MSEVSTAAPQRTTTTYVESASAPKRMKILIHSNGPMIGTGYGVQTRHLADRLAAEGYDVAISATYGHQGPISSWRSPSGHDIRVYPAGYEVNSPDVLIGHADHWFGGDPKTGWIILLVDTWCFRRPLLTQTLRDNYQVVAWTPVDHWPVPRDVLGFLQEAQPVTVAMSRYGAHQLIQAGLDPAYIPLAVDTAEYKPTFNVEIEPGKTVTSRELFDLPRGAFVVGMVAMNKDWSTDRKGFGEAFQAFAEFWRDHQHAVLFVHSEKFGVLQGMNLEELAAYSGIPPHAIVFSDQYTYRIGFPPVMMAAAYTAMDVLLSPSRGEGFCVPLVEAQACGVPVIASSFTAQPELVCAGWTVDGQLDWDPAQHAWYQTANVKDIVGALNAAHDCDFEEMYRKGVEFAAQYDVDRVWAEHWVPFLKTLEPPEPIVREPFQRVDVIVPFMRPDNWDRLVSSFIEHTEARPPGEHIAKLVAVCDEGNLAPAIHGWQAEMVSTGKTLTTYAEKVNLALKDSDADAVLVLGDDTEFTEGWYEALVAASVHGDVIGTNDSEEGRIRNPDVAAGRHADHFAIRRSYIDEVGASLDGPGIAVSEVWGHWYADRELVELAKARGVYVHAHDCRIIHHHPGYDGDEAARQADPVYMMAVEHAEADEKMWRQRAPLIEGHRVTRVRP